MEFIIYDRNLHNKFDREILEMLKAGSNDFVPPLSERGSTTQSEFKKDSTGKTGVELYYNQMMSQRLMLASTDNNLAGFVSFKENYVSDVIDKAEVPNIYISTVMVKKEYRGRRITQSMYNELFNAYKGNNIFTRTWSGNIAHISILSKFGFEEYLRIANDRGEGVDTIYFMRDSLNTEIDA